ncbi:MAG TPA: hypothetical protein VK669_10275 [Candidatus Limnocylindrales bacterium]|nr:hypothetical protein [Candidatus Limnocylindrales bacterium]
MYAVATAVNCSAKQFFTIQAPHIVVDNTVSPGTLALKIRLVSNEPTSLAPAAWRAFVSVDGRPMILNMKAGQTVAVAYPRLGGGMHSVRYGVYRYDVLVQNQFFCREVPPP